jgi:tRNA pseudouridine38-40 synthase
MPRFRMTIEYDGSDYCGWQVQEGDKTVQGEIESALQVIFGQPCAIVGAGRTDSGVHASGQIAHFDHESKPDLHRLKRSLNGILKSDIRIKDIENTDDNFHARFSARWRTYIYRIATQPQALLRNQVWYFSVPLNLDKMNLACEMITGKHDFKSFCRAISEVDNHFCTVKSATWLKKKDLIVFKIKANRYLHGMVRTLVGTMVDVGRERISVDEFAHILNSKNRQNASQSAPAKGLVLEEIRY